MATTGATTAAADGGDRALAGLGSVVLLGCGRMGSALLEGWLQRGLPPARLTVLEPQPPARVAALVPEGLSLNVDPPARAAVCLIAVKPQVVATALARVAPLRQEETLFVSIAAGVPLARLETLLGAGARVVRAMPNTPAAIGRGITALIANPAAGDDGVALAEALLGAVGRTVRLTREDEMDAVTAVSGSGPAYVFLLIEALAAAGEAEGLAADLALELARATVAGAAALAEGGEAPAALRQAVTSPGGTTEAALRVLMDEKRGMRPLLREAVAAAASRSRALAG